MSFLDLLSDQELDAARYRIIRAGNFCPFAETDKAWDSGENLDAAVDKMLEERNGSR